MKYIGVCLSGLLMLCAFFPCNRVFAQQCSIYVDSVEAQDNGTVVFCVNIEQAPNIVDAFGFDIVYDSAILTYAGIWSEGDLTSGFQFLDVNQPAPDQIRAGGFTTENIIPAQAGGTVVCLEFAVGDCAPTTLMLTNLVNDISGWAQCDGQLSCQPRELTSIHLESPADQAILSSPPTFSWLTDGGGDNVFAVEMSVLPVLPKYWSTYRDAHQLIHGTTWQMPAALWNMIPSATPVYWRVRGTDLDHEPRTVVTSEELPSFCKQ